MHAGYQGGVEEHAPVPLMISFGRAEFAGMVMMDQIARLQKRVALHIPTELRRKGEKHITRAGVTNWHSTRAVHQYRPTQLHSRFIAHFPRRRASRCESARARGVGCTFTVSIRSTKTTRTTRATTAPKTITQGEPRSVGRSKRLFCLQEEQRRTDVCSLTGESW